jgi:hypothetical protein
MDPVRLSAIAIAAMVCVAPAAAQDLPPYLAAKNAIEAHFPDRHYSVWTSEVGDLNGDGIDDIAIVMTAARDGQHEERLAVFTGKRDQGYALLAVSGDFCHVRKFYNLRIRKSSLFVEAVMKASGDASASVTLQFRYSAARKDLELIGSERHSEEYAHEAYYRASTNYLSGAVLHERKEQRRRKQARAQIARPAVLAGLQGFDCQAYLQEASPLQINDDFSVSGPAR